MLTVSMKQLYVKKQHDIDRMKIMVLGTFNGFNKLNPEEIY